MTEELKSSSLYEHLEELRRVLLITLIAVLAGTVISYAFFREFLLDIILSPIQGLGENLVFIGVGEGFIAQLKVSLLGGFIISSPVILWQIINFISPALYKNEKRMLFVLLLFAVILFSSGVVFGYYYILGLGLRMLVVTLSGGLTPMISISSYISFVFWFLIPLGVIFQIPIIVYVLSKIGIITPQLLITKRKYVFFIMFLTAALLTPPDVVTQIFLALPMIILYELSIWLSKWVTWSNKKHLKNKPQV